VVVGRVWRLLGFGEEAMFARRPMVTGGRASKTDFSDPGSRALAALEEAEEAFEAGGSTVRSALMAAREKRGPADRGSAARRRSSVRGTVEICATPSVREADGSSRPRRA